MSAEAFVFADLAEWAFKGMIALAITVGITTQRKTRADIEKTKEDLAAFRLEASEKYIKASDIDRLYKLLETMKSEIREDFASLRSQIERGRS